MLEEQFAITPALSSTACFQVRCSLELPGAKLPERKSAGALYTPIYPVCFTDATGELSATARGTGGYGSTGV